MNNTIPQSVIDALTKHGYKRNASQSSLRGYPTYTKGTDKEKKIVIIPGQAAGSGALEWFIWNNSRIVAHGKGEKLLIYNMSLHESAVNENSLIEVTPPGEDWVERKAVKAGFKERYGKRWKAVMYATAWKQHNKKKLTEESQHELEQELTDLQHQLASLKAVKGTSWGTQATAGAKARIAQIKHRLQLDEAAAPKKQRWEVFLTTLKENGKVGTRYTAITVAPNATAAKLETSRWLKGIAPEGARIIVGQARPYNGILKAGYIRKAPQWTHSHVPIGEAVTPKTAG